MRIVLYFFQAMAAGWQKHLCDGKSSTSTFKLLKSLALLLSLWASQLANLWQRGRVYRVGPVVQWNDESIVLEIECKVHLLWIDWYTSRIGRLGLGPHAEGWEHGTWTKNILCVEHPCHNTFMFNLHDLMCFISCMCGYYLCRLNRRSKWHHGMMQCYVH